MILSASRRTDIPALYGEWFMNRLRAGYVLTRNPMRPTAVTRVPLSPDDVDCIVFWTKNAAPFLPYLDELDSYGYRYYFQYTVTAYGRDMEPGLPDREGILSSFCALSDRLGPERVLWRYDPVILNRDYDVRRHASRFEALCSLLSSRTARCTFSFPTPYAKLKSNPLLRSLTDGEKAALCETLSASASRHGLPLCLCADEGDYSEYGVGRARCIDGGLIDRLCGRRVGAKPDRGQRPNCGCVKSVDIGMYHSCTNNCLYCYANSSIGAAKRNFALHRPDGELLYGKVGDGDVVSPLRS